MGGHCTTPSDPANATGHCYELYDEESGLAFCIYYGEHGCEDIIVRGDVSPDGSLFGAEVTVMADLAVLPRGATHVNVVGGTDILLYKDCRGRVARRIYSQEHVFRLRRATRSLVL